MGAIQKQQAHKALLKEHGSQLAEGQIQKLSEQMEVFRGNLQEFASKHKKDIRKNAEFRRQFQEMCAAVGVDPLQSSANFWTKLLGVGDFYYELAIQIVEVCMATNHRNGGIMSMSELLVRVKASRSRTYSKKQPSSSKSTASKDSDDIAVDDLLRAIEKLGKLGGGLRAIPSGKTYIVQSVASEISMDNVTILQKAQENNGHVDHDLIYKSHGWSCERIEKTLSDLVMDGLVWVDKQAPDGKTWYWFPGLSS